MPSSGYGVRNIGREFERVGYSSCLDWLESVVLSFPAPWSIGPDTHYGTEILDSTGRIILSLWIVIGKPSKRERGTMTDEEWSEYCCDSHWECETQWHLANAIIAMRNALEGSDWDKSENVACLTRLVIHLCRWSDQLFDEINCGGPQKRKPCVIP